MSYDVELAAKFIQALTLENASTTYNLTGQLEYNISNQDDTLVVRNVCCILL